jgi:hypothetical protein
VIGAGDQKVGHVCTPGAGVPAPDELIVVRAGTWRLLLPVQHVLRIHPAALPSARPAAEPRSPTVTVEGDVLPVAFAAALAGPGAVELASHHQLVELGDRGRRGLLWVDAAEDVLPFEPAPGAPPPDALVAGWSGAELPLPILDVPRLLDLLCEPGDPSGKESRP